MEDLKLINARLVTPDGVVQGGLTAKDGRITAVGADNSLPPAVYQVDAKGLVVLPGLIDPHLHLGLGAERGKSVEKFASDLATESVSAAVGGITTIISTALFAGAGKSSMLPCMDKAKELGNENSLVDFKLSSFMMTDTHIEEVPALVERGVTSFKFLMAYKGNEGKQVGAVGIDWGFALRGFRAIARSSPPALAMVHAEAAEIIDVLKAEISTQGRNDLAAWTESRPAIAEAMDIAMAGYLALETGASLYFPHVSSSQGMKAAGFLRSQGASIFVETCPHYLTLTQNSPIGNYGKVNPPLREEEDIQSLWNEIQLGAVDTIGSDHAAYQRHHKEGSLWNCMPGFASTGIILPLMLTYGVATGKVSWERLRKITSENTARIFGIYPRKGILAVGSDADFVIVDPNEEWVLKAENLYSASDFSIYEGRKMKGRAVQTFVRGVKVAEGGAPVRKAPYGQYVYPT